MKNYKLGFIGAGNMAEAIFSGAIEKKVLKPNEIFIYDISQDRMNGLCKKYGIISASSIEDLCSKAEMLVLAIKPSIISTVLEKLAEIDSRLPMVSIVAGWSGMKIKGYMGRHDNVRVLRIMPNMPLMSGEGMSVFETPTDLEKNEYIFIKGIFQGLGLVLEQPEKLMDAVTSISGGGPAYVFMFIEALADAGVLNGISIDNAILLAAQTVLGSAQAVLDTGIHPAKLKDAVCSPGGTTIEAVKVLEEKGFRSSIIEAVDACAEKSKKL